MCIYIYIQYIYIYILYIEREIDRERERERDGFPSGILRETWNGAEKDGVWVAVSSHLHVPRLRLLLLLFTTTITMPTITITITISITTTIAIITNDSRFRYLALGDSVFSMVHGRFAISRSYQTPVSKQRGSGSFLVPPAWAASRFGIPFLGTVCCVFMLVSQFFSVSESYSKYAGQLSCPTRRMQKVKRVMNNTTL